MPKSEFQTLLEAALQGDQEALTILRHKPTALNTTALRQIEIALNHDANNSNALFLRAFMHHCGLGGEVNYREAIRLYDQAIALGNAAAMNNRAVMYKHGKGGPVNYPEAICLYEKAIALGNANAMRNRAMMHRNGQGGRKDLQSASELYYQAFQKARAKGTDTTTAFKDLNEMANEGNCLQAQYYLVLICLLDDENKNLKEAEKWYENNVEAISELLYDEIIRRFDDEKPNYAELQQLIDFIVKNDPNAQRPQLKLVQFKALIASEAYEDALAYFESHLISSERISAKDLFQLGNAQINRLESLTEKKDKIRCADQACNFFYAAYKKGDQDCLRLLLHSLGMKQAIETGEENFQVIGSDPLALRRNQVLLKTFEESFHQNNKRRKQENQITAISTFITVVFAQQSTVSRKLSLPWFFGGSSVTEGSKELALAKTILEQLKAGNLLEDIELDLSQFPILKTTIAAQLAHNTILDDEKENVVSTRELK